MYMVCIYMYTMCIYLYTMCIYLYTMCIYIHVYIYIHTPVLFYGTCLFLFGNKLESSHWSRKISCCYRLALCIGSWLSIGATLGGCLMPEAIL